MRQNWQRISVSACHGVLSTKGAIRIESEVVIFDD